MTSAAANSAGQPRSRRERAFLTELPEDFLRVDVPHRSTGGQAQTSYRESHLVPLTYAQAVPQTVAGHSRRLKITIAQAKLNRNYGLTRMDPFCRIRVGNAVCETTADPNGSKNPRWNKTFTCKLPAEVTSMYIEIFNERYLAVDDRIAWAYYELREELYNGQEVEEWINLSGRLGEGEEGTINVILQLLPPSAAHQLTVYDGEHVAMYPPTQPYPPGPMFYPGQYPGYPGPFMPPPGVVPGYGFPPPGLMPQGSQPVPGPVPAARPVKEEDIKQLQEMFPTLEKDIIQSVLEANQGRVDPSVTALLQMTA
ncbi:hypothetical protein EMCRGX_G034266 [Ephydatia muelleri]|eukprot:Em0023g183a